MYVDLHFSIHVTLCVHLGYERSCFGELLDHFSFVRNLDSSDGFGVCELWSGIDLSAGCASPDELLGGCTGPDELLGG